MYQLHNCNKCIHYPICVVKKEYEETEQKIIQMDAEVIKDNDFKFSLDIPEGFEIADYTQDGMSYFFSHPNIPVTLVMKITEEPEAKSAVEVLNKNLNKPTKFSL